MSTLGQIKTAKSRKALSVAGWLFPGKNEKGFVLKLGCSKHDWRLSSYLKKGAEGVIKKESDGLSFMEGPFFLAYRGKKMQKTIKKNTKNKNTKSRQTKRKNTKKQKIRPFDSGAMPLRHCLSLRKQD